MMTIHPIAFCLAPAFLNSKATAHSENSQFGITL